MNNLHVKISKCVIWFGLLLIKVFRCKHRNNLKRKPAILFYCVEASIHPAHAYTMHVLMVMLWAFSCFSKNDFFWNNNEVCIN